MLTESHDEEQIIARVAALDIGKTEVVCCVRVPAGANARKRLQEVSTHSLEPKSAEPATHYANTNKRRANHHDQTPNTKRPTPAPTTTPCAPSGRPP